MPLQKTKLFTPPAREKLVQRPRLTARLDALLDEGVRAALISAPAGFGKTTLMVQWLAQTPVASGWLSLDERDNLPARFFSYLIAALHTLAEQVDHHASEIGREALPLLELPGANPEEIVTLLANDLVELPGPFVLVLDDFHVLTNPHLHQAVSFLIEAQPPLMRLVLLSREDPAVPLARLRARGQLVEFRQADLSFSLPEAVTFLNHSMGLSLTVEQAQILEARTEGWIAGLQMAALALQAPLTFQTPSGIQAPPDLQGPPDLQAPPAIEQPAHAQRFLQNFSGTHRFILDYLVEEVLAGQSAEVQSFLLETSILDRLQAELCAWLTGKTLERAQELLQHLARANLFVIPLDQEAASRAGHGWYRYHHLFGELLLARLQSQTPGHAAELFRRASDWFEAHAESRLAVEYALKAQDFQHAADLIERHLAEHWQTVDIEFFKLVSRLPFEVIAERPTLSLQNAWLYVIFGQTGILPFIEAAERALDRSTRSGPIDAAASRAFAHTLRAYLDDLNNQPVSLPQSLSEALETAHQAIPATTPGMRNSVAVMAGMICFMEGDFAAALQFYEDALALDKRMNGTNAVPIATIRICQVLQVQGQLHQAMRRLRAAEAYIRARGARRFYISGTLNLYIADILIEWNQIEAALVQIDEGIRLLQDWPFPAARSLGLSLLARLHILRGDLNSATAMLEQVDAIRRENDLHPIYLDAIERARVNLLLAQQDWPALEAWAAQNTPVQSEPIQQQPLHFRYEARRIELCRVWLALGRMQQAAAQLERLAGAAQDRQGSRVRILALWAAALYQQPDQALPLLDEALQLGEPEGYLRTFIDAGQPLQQLLRLWLQHGPSQDAPRLQAYVQTILSAAPHAKTGDARPQPAELIEPLSPREREVLLLVAEGLTNQQIAGRLVISVRTVKKHVQNIHGKLGVQNRTQAVARARELGLLE